MARRPRRRSAPKRTRSYSRRPATRRRSTARRSRPQEVRIVIEQPATASVGDDALGVLATSKRAPGPKKARF